MSSQLARIGGAMVMLSALAQPLHAVAAEHRYRVAVDAALRHVDVHAQLGRKVAWLSARDGDAAQIAAFEVCDGGRPGAVRATGKRMVMSATASCVNYRYPLTATAGRRGPRLAPGVVVSFPSEWLWTPEPAPGDRLRIELSMPAAMRASVPWKPLEARVFELPPSPGSGRAVVVFGSFEQREIAVPGARLQLALLPGPGERPAADDIVTWLRTAAMDVAAVYGRFPNPAPQVIVQPSGSDWDEKWSGGGSAVPFGYVIRDGGEAVRFFVGAGRPLADYLADWTATHEFSHLLLPYVRSEDKWVSEGFASYYQNVLLARRGVYGERDVWRRLYRAFNEAAAITDPPPLNRITDRPFWEVRMLIYWSGAAVALIADTELRRLSGSAESLDTVLGRLQRCCLPSDRVWSAAELFARLDELSKYPVFVDLYRQYAVSPGMPVLEGLYARLGVVPVGSSDVTLSDAAPDARVRRAITEKTKS